MLWERQQARNFTLNVIDPGTQIVLSDSGPLLIGKPMTLTAVIEDSSGNPVTAGPDSTVSVVFAQTGGTGTVSGLGSFNAVNGVATDMVTATSIGDDSEDFQASAALSLGATSCEHSCRQL